MAQSHQCIAFPQIITNTQKSSCLNCCDGLYFRRRGTWVLRQAVPWKSSRLKQTLEIREAPETKTWLVLWFSFSHFLRTAQMITGSTHILGYNRSANNKGKHNIKTNTCSKDGRPTFEGWFPICYKSTYELFSMTSAVPFTISVFTI